MNQPSRNLWRVVALWAILLQPVVSGADDDDDPPAEDVPRKRGIVIEESPIEESKFDRLVFQQNQRRRGVPRSVSAADGRARIDSQLKAMLDELVQVCQLNEAQQKKLAVAGRGDMKRFFDQVEEVRKKFLAARNDQNQLQPVWQECSSLQQRFSRGLFGEESLFAKTLRKTLTPEQQARYQAVVLDGRRVGYRTAIEASLAKLGNGVALRREQYEALQKLLLDETQPPLIFGQYDQQVVMLRLSQLPATQLRKVLDNSQWKQLHPQLLQASGTEDSLAQNGVIEEPKSNAPVVLRSVRTVVDAPATTPADAVQPE